MVRGRRRGSLRGRGGSRAPCGRHESRARGDPPCPRRGRPRRRRARAGRGARRHRAPLPVRRRLVDVVRGFDRLGHVGAKMRSMASSGTASCLRLGTRCSWGFRTGRFSRRICVAGRLDPAVLVQARRSFSSRSMASSVSLSASASSCARLVLVVVGDVRGGAGGVGSERAPVVVVAIELEGSILALASSPVMRGSSCVCAVCPSRLTMSASSASAAPHKLGGGLLHRGPGLLAELGPFGSVGNLVIAGWCAACTSTSQRCVTTPRARTRRERASRQTAQPRTLKSSTSPFVCSSSPADAVSPRSLDASSASAAVTAPGEPSPSRGAERSTPARAAASPGAANTESAPRVKDPGGQSRRLVRLAGGAGALDHRGAAARTSRPLRRRRRRR